MHQPKISLAVKTSFSVWMAVWIPAYWVYYGPENFLWFCDFANFVIAAGLWLESGLLLSSQAIAVLILQILWSIDFLVRLLLGFHPIGGTEYMFESSRPLLIRALSLYHLVVPILLVWAVRKVGYDHGGWRLQTLLSWIILPMSYFFGDAERNLNWLWAPFGHPQTLVPTTLFVGLSMALLPLVIFWPSHLCLSRLLRKDGSN